MDEKLQNILAEYRKGLEAIYGDRLKRLILYGSQARGDATPESDIDVLVVLEGPVDPYEEIERVVQLSEDISLRYDVFIQPTFAAPEDVETREQSFYRNVRREGLAM